MPSSETVCRHSFVDGRPFPADHVRELGAELIGQVRVETAVVYR